MNNSQGPDGSPVTGSATDEFVGLVPVANPESETHLVSLGAAIANAARSHTMILIGAAESGVLSRLACGAPTVEVLEDVECSVFLGERKTKRGLWRRLVGRP